MPVHHIDLRKREPEVSRYSLNQYANDIAVAFQGQRYILSGGSSGWTKTEDIEHSFTSYIGGLYKTNGIVFAIILARMLLFTEARFCWFEINDNGEDGRPKGRKGLEVLERPWPNCGTGELLARMEQDVSLGGNFYAVREGNRLRRLRPDWVTIVLTAPPAESTYSDVAGYWYHPGRSFTNAGEPGPGDEVYLPDECAHWSPLPDPDAQYRGMSWLTPVVREVMADKASMEHKLNFFTNGATLGAIISAKESLTNNQYKEWKANFEGVHSGAANAYKSLFLASPVDVSVLSANMQQLDFKVTTGAGETRLCAAGGVPPIIVGLSEGLASATYSNYGMARRKFGDHWAHPQWKSASQALSGLVDPPDGDVRLGVNTKGIAFLREDAKDLAEIEQIKASTLSTLIMAGYEPDSCVAAVEAEDLTLLKHSGLTSVQLVPPGTAEGSPEDVAAEEEYDVLLDEFRSRAVEDEIQRDRYDVRNPAGSVGGGRFRKLSDAIVALLRDAEGDEDPLEDLTQPQLKKAAEQLGLTEPRKRYTKAQLKVALLKHARGDEPDERPKAKPAAKKAAPKAAQTAEAREIEVENRIRAAYREELARRGETPGRSTFVGLADIREALGEDYPRAEVDRVLRDMARRSGDPNSPGAVRLITTANTKALKQRDLDAAIPMHGASQGPQHGGLHSIAMADPSDRPLPGDAPDDKPEPKAPAKKAVKKAAPKAPPPDGPVDLSEMVDRLRRLADSEDAVAEALRDVRAGDVRELAYQLNLDLPTSLKTATARKQYIAQTLVSHKRRMGGFRAPDAPRFPWMIDDGPDDTPAAAPKAPAKKATPRAPAKKAPKKPAGDSALSDDPAVREVQVENRIRAAYRELTSASVAPGRGSGHSSPLRGSGYATLADVRDRLGDIPRSEQDAALRRLIARPDVGIVPWVVSVEMTPRQEAAAIRLGGEDKHYIHFDDPSDRPLPGDAPDDKPEPKAPAKKAVKKAAPKSATDGAYDRYEASVDAAFAPDRVREAEVENKIRAAYRDLVAERDDLPGSAWQRAMRRSGDQVSIADLRERAAEENVRTDEFDAALQRMTTGDGDGNAVPESAQGELTARDRSAAFRQGDQAKHWLHLDDPSDRPLPAESATPDPLSSLRTLDPEAADLPDDLVDSDIEDGEIIVDRDSLVRVESAKTVAELRQIAKDRQIKIPSRVKLKAEIRDYLRNELRLRPAEDVADYFARTGGRPKSDRLVGHLHPGGGEGAAVAGEAALLATTLRVGGSGYHGPGLYWRGDRVPAGLSADDLRLGERALAEYRLPSSISGGRSHADLNNWLRGKRHTDVFSMSDDQAQQAVDAIDRLMEHAPITQDVVVWRVSGAGEAMFGARQGTDLTGFTWTDQGYISTSANPDTLPGAEGTIRMRMVVPRGTRGVQLTDYRIRDANEEAEILLERGLTLRVVRDGGIVDGRRMLDVEVVPARQPTGRPSSASPNDRLTAPEIAGLHEEGLALAVDEGRLSAADAVKEIRRRARYRQDQLDTAVSRLGPGSAQQPDLVEEANYIAGLLATADALADPAPRADLSVSRDERIRQLMATGMTRKQATEQIRQENASRSTEPDEDDIERADYDDHPGEPDDEMRARAQACLDDCDEDAEEPDDADYDMYRAAGADTNLGGERLHYWWTKGPGLARWVNSPHPWTALYTQLREHVGAARAKRMASAWFHEVFGIWSGERKGSNPVGPG